MASAIPDPQPTNPAPPTDEKSSTETPTPETQQSPPSPTQPAPAQSTAIANDDDDDDDDSDFDELDEVLDNFKPKAPAPAPAPAPSASAPAPNPDTTSAPAPTTTSNPEDAFDEEAFMRQLEKDMASMMGQEARESSAGADSQGFESTIDQGADAFTKQLEESGIPPGDFLKQLLADVMAESGGDAAGASSSTVPKPSGDAAAAPPPESFNDAIQATINRMKESGDKATAAAEEDDLSGDLVAQLLKAVEAGAGSGDDGDLTKMFMGMMEQLSNKEMLYEPMKELDTKFQPWIVEHRGSNKISADEMTRYESQAAIVSQIVAKFEEPGYTDEDPKCREYVWEKMQEMQAAGNPPEELVANPWMDDLKGPGGGAGAGGMPDCPQQ